MTPIKPRHPHQMEDVSDLTVGDRYAFVSASLDAEGTCVGIDVNMRVIAGVMSDTVERAAAGGHRRARWDLTRYRLAGKLSEVPISALLDDNALNHVTDTMLATVHLDGWSGAMDKGQFRTLAYWTKQRMWSDWDYAATFFNCHIERAGLCKPCKPHVVVPEDLWLADPRIHGACDESSAAIKRSVQTRTDENLRRVFN